MRERERERESKRARERAKATEGEREGEREREREKECPSLSLSLSLSLSRARALSLSLSPQASLPLFNPPSSLPPFSPFPFFPPLSPPPPLDKIMTCRLPKNRFVSFSCLLARVRVRSLSLYFCLFLSPSLKNNDVSIAKEFFYKIMTCRLPKKILHNYEKARSSPPKINFPAPQSKRPKRDFRTISCVCVCERERVYVCVWGRWGGMKVVQRLVI